MEQQQSEHYTVLARRFRPQAFDEVVGQEHVAQALRNAIGSNRVAHAYLFTGARGVGKTSMARILAKSLNCPNVTENALPCNDCELCNGISAGNDVDVMEIDGASNRGIDDIRSLRANVNVKSMRSSFKIYIIDEVHMLTKEAFNALLKTLEEPPPKVKFVFCTTEPNKVPDTILSRCQRFDFGTIETQRIAERLKQIAEVEGKTVDNEAIDLVARRAAGSMRDSQSLFDQLLAFGGQEISASDVHRLLGTASDDRLVALADTLVKRDRGRALELFGQALNDGIQLREFTDQLIEYFRDLIVVASGADACGLMSVANSKRELLQSQANEWGLETICTAMQIFAETKGKMQRATYGRALAELALIRISLLQDMQAVADAVAHLKNGQPLSASARPATSAPKPAAKIQKPPEANATPPVEKKNEPIAHKDEPKSAENRSVIAGRVSFSPGHEDELWSQMLSEINDMLSDHIKKVSEVAISGPNRLDLTFPKSYDFNKQYCERAEVRTRLEAVASELAGQPVSIGLLVKEGERDDLAVEAKPDVQQRKRPLEAGDDEFVASAQNIFGGTVVKVDEIR